MEQLPYEFAHALNDGYIELKGLADDLDTEIRQLESVIARSQAEDDRLREVKTIRERIGYGLSGIGYTLYHLDAQAVSLHPELQQKYGGQQP